MLAFFVTLTGCAATEESSSGGGSLPELKVSVSGLHQGKNVILSSGQSTAANVFTENEALGITTDGTYSFGSFSSGTSYDITVRQQPVSQTCTVTEGEGTLSASTTVVVTCSSESHTISGTVVGLYSGQSVTLQNNSGDNLTVSSNTSFSFTTKVGQGDTYLVTVKTQPTGQICTPNLNSGVVTDNVSDVSIICSYTVYTVSGSVSGLSGTLVLQNNYGGDQTLTNDGSFSFQVASSAKYNIRVKTQPNGKCVVSNGSGTASADVDNVSVGCWVLVDGGVSSTGVNKNSTYRADNVSLHVFPTANNLFEAAFGNNTFVAVGSSPTVNNLSGVTFGNNTFVAVGDSGNIVRSTNNGSSFNNVTTDNSTGNTLRGVTFGDSTFVAVGDSGNIVRSTNNGSSFDNATTDNSTGNTLRGVTFGNNTFVAVGDSGNIVRSTNNGSSWENATSPTANGLYGVTFENNTFVAVGDSGNIVRSTDNGSSWENATSPTTNGLYGVTFGNNTFVAVGDSGNIVRSTNNGSSWENATSPTANDLYGVTFGNNTFVGVGLNGNIIKSTDNGTSWEKTTSYSNSKLYVSWSEISQYGSISQIRVKSYDNSSWSTIDGDSNNGINLIKSRNATHPSLADNGTHVFAVWSEDNGAGKGLIRSAVYDNGSRFWDFQISNFQPLNNSTSYSANNPQLLYHSSSLYAIWSENNGTANQIRVKQFDNSSSWNLVDNTGANTTGINKNTGRNAINPKIQIYNSEIYAAWSEDDGSATQIRVAKFDNSSSWTFVDGNASTGINKTTGKDATDPAMAVLSNKLYIAWSETNADNRTQIRVKSYDGSNWSFVDGENATKGINKDYTQNTSYPQLVTVTEGKNIVRSTDDGVSWDNATSNSSSSKLYAVWLEENGSTQVRVAEFDGTSTWSFKDGNSFDGLNLNTAKITGKPSAAAYLNQLIVAWSETNSLGVPQIRVAKSPF
ncbi:MAG: hypothetical protein VYA87_00790 [SAR324 cluster bacterium]|nr:hypothetical protein [SAR324 cluster bacterium]